MLKEAVAGSNKSVILITTKTISALQIMKRLFAKAQSSDSDNTLLIINNTANIKGKFSKARNMTSI